MDRSSSRPATSTSCASCARRCPGVELEPLPDRGRAAARGRRHLRRERARQGARGPARRPAGPRSPTTPGSRPPRSAAGPGSARRATPARTRATRRTWRSCSPRSAGEDRRVAYVCVIALVDDDGAEQLFEGRCEGDADRRAARERRLRLRPGLRPGRHRARTTSGRWPSSRPTRSTRSATAGRRRPRRWPSDAGGGRRVPQMTITKPAAAGGLDRLQLAPDRAEAGGRGDHRLDRDPERGDPLLDRPDRLGDRLRLGPPRRRARRRRAPLRPREGRERRRLDRGDADPGRRRGHHLRVGAPAGRAAPRSRTSGSGSR